MATATAPKKYKFRLLRGAHAEKVGAQPDGRPIHRMYQADVKKGVYPIVETDHNLAAFNMSDAPPKFEALTGVDVPLADPTVRQPGETLMVYLRRMNELSASLEREAANARNQLESMNLEQLLSFVAENGIEVDVEGDVEIVRARILAELD